MQTERKDIAKGLGIAAVVGLGAYAISRLRPPPDNDMPPVEEGEGALQGYILNSHTRQKLAEGTVQIIIDGETTIWNTADSEGGYRTPILTAGTYHFIVTANNFKTQEFVLEVPPGLTAHQFSLEPLGPVPGQWTPGVQVQYIQAAQKVNYLGSPVSIKVGVHCYEPIPVPGTIYGSIEVDGEVIQASFEIDFRNPTLRFEYFPSRVGTLTVQAQDKSNTFEVVEDPVGAYYNPFGGTRAPVCVEMTANGIRITGAGAIGCPWDMAHDTFRTARPTAWSPDYSSVSDHVLYLYDVGYPLNRYLWFVVTYYVIPVEWSPKPLTWESKEELSKALARSTQGSWGFRSFPEGEEAGVIVDPRKGVKDWQKQMVWGYDRPLYAGIKFYQLTLRCPYCNQHVMVPSDEGRLALIRKLLEHIEGRHPEHPLSEPAWF